ncbi:MAG: acetate kinase [Firmicutes bacterium]|nr:acetate kinase [Bacillota bacterium]
MKIFVLNCGSSSVKYKLYQMHPETLLAEGKVERIGEDDAELKHVAHAVPGSGKTVIRKQTILEHRSAIQTVLDLLTHPEHGVIQNAGEIGVAGHRVVHGGEHFSDSVQVDSDVKRLLSELNELAPLHNPHNIEGISAAEEVLPGVPNVAVFDTAFHATIPRYAHLYAVPYLLYERHRIRRYGFHGTSHKYVSRRAAELMGRPYEELRIISCHLGNGASVAAIAGGRSVDTSMGFTPLEGLIMGTRSGDVDPGMLFYVMAKEDLGLGEVDAMLNKHSGVFGISGLGDMREVEDAAARGDQRALLAFEMYEYRVRKYIGAYTAAMDGVDAMVFTAGVGENSPRLRSAICSHLAYLGVTLDPVRNERAGGEREITTPGSPVKVFVIPTNEELVIAREAMAVIARSRPQTGSLHEVHS